MLKKLFFILSITVILCGWQTEHVSAAGTVLDLEYAARADNFQWNIAGDLHGQNPNILSELTWRGLRANQIQFGLESNLGRKLFLKGWFAPGWVGGGLVRDSDYLGNNRTVEFSKTVSLDKGDTLHDASLSLGLNIAKTGNFEFRPLFGYSFSEQNLRISDGIQVIPDTGPVDDLNSTYQTQWNGPALGMDIQARIGKRALFVNNLEYHWVDYKATGDWNLRDDLNHPLSFMHTAQGKGIVISIGVDVVINQNVAAILKVSYQNWHTSPGIDRIFRSDGTEVVTRFNGAGLESYGIMVGVRYKA